MFGSFETEQTFRVCHFFCSEDRSSAEISFASYIKRQEKELKNSNACEHDYEGMFYDQNSIY